MNLRSKQEKFMGHLLATEGLKPDPENVQAVKDMPKSTHIQGIQRRCGFVSYLAAFLTNQADILQPIRQLTHKVVPWNWADVQECAFEEIKKLVTSAPV